MNREEALILAVERAISEETGALAKVIDRDAVGGGCISRAQRLRLEDGREVFLKSNADLLPQMFQREAEGLAALAEVGAIAVARPLAVGGGSAGEIPFLVIEFVRGGQRRKDFFEVFGRSLAELHLRSRSECYGFDHDNYVGSTPQPNARCGDWVEFFREHRLGHQLRLAAQRGLSDARMRRAGQRLLDRLDALIGVPQEPPCLLHGDLWGGNYLVNSEGDPVLIDPAAYYGRREADLAMTQLFGGFDAHFYRAYQERWPLASGSDERLEIYKLYHLLNHLNLFGGGYRSSCMSIIERYGGES